MTPGPGGGDFESADKYAVCLLDFFDNSNTVEKHLFFLIQSILLFHDRCCFTFFSARPIYMYDYNDKNTLGKHLFFLFKVYYIF
jgi:hypothetical protein